MLTNITYLTLPAATIVRRGGRKRQAEAAEAAVMFTRVAGRLGQAKRSEARYSGGERLQGVYKRLLKYMLCLLHTLLLEAGEAAGVCWPNSVMFVTRHLRLCGFTLHLHLHTLTYHLQHSSTGGRSDQSDLHSCFTLWRSSGRRRTHKRSTHTHHLTLHTTYLPLLTALQAAEYQASEAAKRFTGDTLLYQQRWFSHGDNHDTTGYHQVSEAITGRVGDNILYTSFTVGNHTIGIRFHTHNITL